jgi:Mg/Co/Ni transporter MgtE
MKNTELKNITALDEIAAIISGNDSPKAMMNRLDDYHGSDISEVIRTELRLIASFDDDEIGSRITANCMIIGEDMPVKQAMNALVSQARKNDNISTLFVVDESNVFSGAIDLKDLITADSSTALESICLGC